MKPLTNAQYITEVVNYPGNVILFFTAPWAKPAIKTANFLRSTNLNVKIFSIDYDSERELVKKYSIREIPTVICVKNGQTSAITDVCETQVQMDNLLK